MVEFVGRYVSSAHTSLVLLWYLHNESTDDIATLHALEQLVDFRKAKDFNFRGHFLFPS